MFLKDNKSVLNTGNQTMRQKQLSDWLVNGG